jgi:glucosamine--fructose-6-phosphate aminotransferase (isomerizing)
MCGIVGYIGHREATPLLIEGLRRLEYRGYDSAGLTVASDGSLVTRKAVGKIQDLERHLDGDGLPGSRCGIAHTRWATHGAPNEVNAHPHSDCSGEIAVVHNGIIENSGTLKKKLASLGHEFRTETDTEVIAHLIEETWAGSLEEAVRSALSQVEGTFGLAIMSSREPGKVVGARRGSPLLVGVGDDGEYFLASDVAAVLSHTRDFVYLEDGEMAVLSEEGYQIYSLKGRELAKEVTRVDWELDAIEKSGFDHFMLKEIFEQPETLEDAMRGRLLEEEGVAKLGGLQHLQDELGDVEQIIITASGTSWHAGLIGEYMIEEFAGIPVEVEYASEFRYRNPVIRPNTVLIAISQSGETADTLAAVREGRRQGATAMGIVNVVGSTIARETDGGVYIHAGPEIGVASTKAFTSQVVTLALFTLLMARQRGMSALRGREIVQALHELPGQVRRVLELNDAIRELSRTYKDAGNFLYL